MCVCESDKFIVNLCECVFKEYVFNKEHVQGEIVDNLYLIFGAVYARSHTYIYASKAYLCMYLFIRREKDERTNAKRCSAQKTSSINVNTMCAPVLVQLYEFDWLCVVFDLTFY